jgi:hypothetical protein
LDNIGEWKKNGCSASYIKCSPFLAKFEINSKKSEVVKK